MSDFVVSLIRTNVPIAVGALISWLVSLGIVVPDGAEVPLTIAITAFAAAGYYAAARWLEKRWPAFGYLLGTKAEPRYSEPRPDVHILPVDPPAGPNARPYSQPH